MQSEIAQKLPEPHIVPRWEAWGPRINKEKKSLEN